MSRLVLSALASAVFVLAPQPSHGEDEPASTAVDTAVDTDAVSSATVPAPEQPRRIDALIVGDLFRASSHNDGPGAGTPATLTATEAGMRLRIRGRNVAPNLSFDLDYRGRESVGGTVSNAPRRVFYRAEVAYDLAGRRLRLAGGRFTAPAVGLLVIDGLRAEGVFGSTRNVTLTGYAGRRALTSSLTNVEIDRYLPAAGGSLRFQTTRLHVDTGAAYTEDLAVMASASSEPREEPVSAASAWVHANARPVDAVSVGTSVMLAQRAGYVLGPTWSDYDLRVEALDFWRGLVFARWRPRHDLRVGADVYAQRTRLFREGVVAPDPADTSQTTLVPELEDPTFADVRVEGAYRPLEMGWVRLEGRFRHRRDRDETRGGLRIDADRLGIGGLYARGRLAVDALSFSDARANATRVLWSASAGYRWSTLDAEAGASFIERGLTPVSGRLLEPRTPDDLSPFTLSAQRVAFARLFYGWRNWYGVLDTEMNLADVRADELRVFLQVGWVFDREW